MSLHNEGSVLSVASCMYCFRPEMAFATFLSHHGSGSFNQCSISSFSYSILLRSPCSRVGLRNPFFNAERVQSNILELSPIVTSKHPYRLFVENFCIIDKINNAFCSFTLVLS